MLFPWTNIKRERRARVKRSDVIVEQVKDLLQKENQKLILMVRG